MAAMATRKQSREKAVGWVRNWPPRGQGQPARLRAVSRADAPLRQPGPGPPATRGAATAISTLDNLPAGPAQTPQAPQAPQDDPPPPTRGTGRHPARHAGHSHAPKSETTHRNQTQETRINAQMPKARGIGFRTSSPLYRAAAGVVRYWEQRGIDPGQCHLHGVDVRDRETPYFAGFGWR